MENRNGPRELSADKIVSLAENPLGRDSVARALNGLHALYRREPAAFYDLPDRLSAFALRQLLVVAVEDWDDLVREDRP
jgi:hypothetical protein